MQRPWPLLLCAVSVAAGHAADPSPALKDPTQPPLLRDAPEQHGSAPRGPVVSAIFVSPTRSVAVFNDQPVRAGDRVGGYRIEEVSAHGVRYSADGHTGFAPLSPTR